MDNEKYKKAVAFAAEKHKGQFRKGGDEYITHPIAVAEIIERQGLGDDYIITALFHDLLEDTDATEAEIEQIGDKTVINAVKLLTKYDGYVMENYIDGIRKNDIAFKVKAADRLHNLRSAVCAEREFKIRYIIETLEWYMDFSEDIPEAVKILMESL